MWRHKEAGTLLLEDSSLGTCQGVLFEPEAGLHLRESEDVQRFLEAIGENCSGVDKSQLKITACTVHLCQTAVNFNSHKIHVDCGSRYQKAVLTVLLNRLAKDDLRYTVSEDHVWHKCERRVKKKWTPCFLRLQDRAEDTFDSFNTQLDRALEVIRKEKSKLASSFVLVALENRDENIYSVWSGTRVDVDSPSTVTSEDQVSYDAVLSNSGDLELTDFNFEELQKRNGRETPIELTGRRSIGKSPSADKRSSGGNYSASTSSSDSGFPSEGRKHQLASRVCDPLSSKKSEVSDSRRPISFTSSSTSGAGSPPLSIPPPFEPAPFIPQAPAPKFPVEHAVDNCVASEQRKTLNEPQKKLSDSLYILPSELPSRLESILLSAEKDSLLSHKELKRSDLDRMTKSSQKAQKTRGHSEKEMAAKSPQAQEVEKIAILLQTAINNKETQHASEFAVKLTQADVLVSITAQPKSLDVTEKDPEFWLKVYVEDKQSSAGGLSLKVKATDTIRDLKNKMLMKHRFPVEVQTWIVGKRIPADTETLSRLGIKGQGNTAFLYLVSPRSVGLTYQAFQERMEQILHAPQLPGGQQLPERQEGPQWVIHPYNTKQSLPTPKAVLDQQGAPRIQQYPQSAEARLHAARSPDDMYITPAQMLETASPSPKQQKQHHHQQQHQQLLRQQEEPRRQHELRQRLAPAEDFHLEQTPSPNVFSPTQAGLPGHGITDPSQLSDRSVEEIENGWACSACTYINKPTRPGCEVCTHPRPPDYHVPEGYKMTLEEKERLQMEELFERQTREALEARQAEQKRERQHNYQQMRLADSQDLIPNTTEFQCPVCFDDIAPGEGVVLRECLHPCCRTCLKDAVTYNEEPLLKCPFVDDQYRCEAVLQEREIKALVPKDVYEKYLTRSLSTAESQAQNSFHCKTADCPGWCFYEDHVNFFVCPVCRKENCLTCKAIHEGRNCKQYQEDLKRRSQSDREARQTQKMIDKMVDEGNAMPCPQCQVVVMKKDGCDWIQCSICKTEICWVTKGPRWGPLGNGDISGGCQCRVNGKVCHQDCNNCH